MEDKEIAKIICKECLTHKKDCIGGKANLPCLMAEFCGKAVYNDGYRKLPEDSVVLTREELKEHDKTLANDIITMFQKLAQNWASADIVNDTAKRLRKLYGV